MGVSTAYQESAQSWQFSLNLIRNSFSLFLSLLLQCFLLNPYIHSYNGCLANGDKGRRRSRLALSRRPHANGVKPDVMHHISTPLVSKASCLSQLTGCCPRAKSSAFLDLPAHSPAGAGESTVSSAHCLFCYQRNDGDGKSFAGCTIFYNLQNVSLTTRPCSFMEMMSIILEAAKPPRAVCDSHNQVAKRKFWL